MFSPVTSIAQSFTDCLEARIKLADIEREMLAKLTPFQREHLRQVRDHERQYRGRFVTSRLFRALRLNVFSYAAKPVRKAAPPNVPSVRLIAVLALIVFGVLIKGASAENAPLAFFDHVSKQQNVNSRGVVSKGNKAGLSHCDK